MLKPEKCLKMRQNPTRQLHLRKMASHHVSPKKLGRVSTSSTTTIGAYCKWQTRRPYKAMEMGLHALPSCTVVTDQNDVSIGGAIGDPV